MASSGGWRALAWEGDAGGGALLLLDQTRLPAEEVWLRLEEVPGLVEAIRRLAVRGAPLLGCAGAYGTVLAARGLREAGGGAWFRALEEAARPVAEARPTAVNLAGGVERVLAAARAAAGRPAGERLEALLAAARAVQEEDEELCRRIGEHGAPLLPEKARVLTHCNTGRLATAGEGTALAVLRRAWRSGRLKEVLADETRPLLQGARLTVWELERDGIPVVLQCDGAAAWALASGRVDAVITGADRIAANGDVANKIGTLGLAVLARHYGVPFYVAAPSTTVDLRRPDAGAIPVEERDPTEVACFAGQAAAPPGTEAWNPAFDLTPAGLVSALITERGVLRRPDAAGLARHLAGDAQTAESEG